MNERKERSIPLIIEGIYHDTNFIPCNADSFSKVFYLAKESHYSYLKEMMKGLRMS